MMGDKQGHGRDADERADHAGADQDAADDRTTDPDIRARESARLMMAEDRASQHLGIALLAIAPGRARVSMAVRAEFTNGHGVCHGGYIFLLADTAFAFASNSHNQRAVAAGASIEFLAPAHEGDVLTAEGVEQHVAGRHGVYDIEVINQDCRTIALFRGKSATIKGRFFEEAP